MKFSEKVRKLRIRKGLSQEELAEKLDVSRQTVSKWEAGSSLPEIEKLIFLSDFFQVSIDYLLRDKQINTNFSEDLDRMVIKFLGSSYEMADISRQLVDMMELLMMLREFRWKTLSVQWIRFQIISKRSEKL